MDRASLLNLGCEMAYVWYLMDKRFRKLYSSWVQDINWDHFNWKEALVYARRNFVLYRFCQEALKNRGSYVDSSVVQTLDSIVKQGDFQLKRLLKTLTITKDLWDGRVEYYVIKTRDDRPTYDVDVLFVDSENYESAIDLATGNGYRFIREEPFKGWIDVEDAVKIELHQGVSWFGMKALDNDFVVNSPRTVTLLNLMFQTVNEEAELALDLAHWIMDIQPLTLEGFWKLVSNIEKEHSLKELVLQAEKYGWAKQLTYHLSALTKLCEYAYSYQLELPIRLFNTHIRPHFPFWVPSQMKIPFLMRKVLHDNKGSILKSKMLQLSLRRYIWTRVWT